MPIKKLPLTIVLSLLLGLISCNSNYSVSTNLDKSNFKDYFSPSKVSIYESEKDIEGKHEYVGLVEGEDCQLKSHHSSPDKINARTDARRIAYEKGANGIIFTGCALVESNSNAQHTNLDSKQCVSTMVCYGKAFKVANSESE